MDVAIASTALVVLGPVIGVIAITIRVTMGSPVLFRHVRPGYRGRPFELIKFRSMLPETGPDGGERTFDQRVTRLGLLLRRSSLDELPELWNVLKGDMSLVGPRPLQMAYLPRYTPEQARRHDVRPGITGLAQISGRHMLTWEERFRLDVWYVDHWSFLGDVKILMATPATALKGYGVPDPTAPDWEFKGPTGSDAGDADGVSDDGPERPPSRTEPRL